MLTREGMRDATEDLLLRRAYRGIGLAKASCAGAPDRRRLLIAMSDLQSIVSELENCAREIDAQLQSILRHTSATAAYGHCLKLRRRAP